MSLTSTKPMLPRSWPGLRLPASALSWRAPADSTAGVVIGVSIGTALVAAAYAGARAHDGWALVAFWAGWILSFLVLASAVTSAGGSARRRLAIVLIQATQQVFIRWMYDPLQFSFPDELQHWRTATDILARHHLFHNNPTLPVSPVFPGLEEIATSIVSLTHLGLFPAGLIVAAVSHVGLAAALFYWYQRVCRDTRIAGVAAFLFALNPLHSGFDTQFIYEAPALLFGAVLLEVASREHLRPMRDGGIGLLSAAALVVTHHLTAAVIIGTLVALGVVVGTLTRLGRLARQLMLFGVVTAALAAAWVFGAARPVLTYLGVPLKTVLTGILHFGNVSGTVKLPAAAGGGPGTWLTIAGALITVILIVFGAVLLWHPRRPSRPVLPRVFAVFAFSYFAILGIREFAPDGAEMAGRLLTFAALFTSVPMAFALTKCGRWTSRSPRLWRGLALLAMLGIFAGGMMSGWPAPWEQLPGRFHVSGFESGIDRQNSDAVRWLRAHVGPGHRVACDFSSCSLLGAHGGETPVLDEPQLFYEPTVDSRVVTILRHRQVKYVFVDLRMSLQPPVTGHFFQVGTSHAGGQDRPVPRPALTKFDGVPWMQLIYDSGTIRIYAVGVLPHE